MDKSELVPTQRTIFLGMQIDTVEFKVRPSEDRLSRLDAVLRSTLLEEAPSAKTYLRVLGHMASLEKLIPLARLQIRPLQQHLADSWSTDQDMETPVPISLKALEVIQWWQNRGNLTTGVRVHPSQPDHLLYTDASNAGWGAHVAELRAQGLWSQQEKSWHINSLELEALWKGLQVFKARLKQSHVVAMTDNTTVVAQIKNQGGTVSRQLTRQTTELLTWAQDQQITLTARHIPGHLNVIADSLSRDKQLLPGEWSLNPNVCNRLWKLWGRPQIDLFALSSNNKLPLYVSPVADDQAIGLDGLSQQWDRQEVYAYPPTTLIQAVLLRLAASNSTKMTLIAPSWPSQIWFPQLLEMLIATPRRLGNSPTLLQQKGRFHENPEVLNLHAWRLLSEVTERRGFQQQLQHAWREQPGNPQTEFTSQSGNTLLVGVTAGKRVLSRPLFL